MRTPGRVLTGASAEPTMARFLALTGWRSGEAQALRWSELDLSRRTATLADSKTGRSIRPLSHEGTHTRARSGQNENVPYVPYPPL